MQFGEFNNDDVSSGYKTYQLVIDENNNEIKFCHYRGETLGFRDVNDAAAENRFLRKGFSEAIKNTNFDFLTPIYTDLDGKEVTTNSKEEALNLIYEGKLSISGFKISENASEEQRKDIYEKVLRAFIATANDLDFSSEKHIFDIFYNSPKIDPDRRVTLNGGGSEKITGYDVQEKLGIETANAENHRKVMKALDDAREKLPQKTNAVDKENEVSHKTNKFAPMSLNLGEGVRK